MSESERLKQLFTYDLWANKKIGGILVRQENPPPKGVKLFAHISAAQQIWFLRINGYSADDIELWPGTMAVMESMHRIEEMHPGWQNLLAEKIGSLSDNITYKNSSGRAFTTPLAGILHHVVIHGQHHRAQIATLLREQNVKPPATDFIFYLREV